MSVMLETSLGESAIVIDLFCDEAPLACKNFLKLCKIKYYHGCLFYNVQTDFMIQTGDPTATGKGGTSVYGIMYGEQARFFEDEIRPQRKHDRKGLVSMANMGQPNTNGSQFFITMRDEELDHLDGRHTIFGCVAEGMDVLERINEQFVDSDGRPYRDIRLTHTHILDDPYEDPAPLEVPPGSPEREKPREEKVVPRLGATEDLKLDDGKTAAEVEKALRDREAKSHAVVLEMIGDLPDADVAPPDNVLFICKLNPVTTDDDLEIIFSRFGPCRADITKDHITGDSLNYGFIEFDEVAACEEAFKKMNNVLIDDRRIRVDFSQSVSKEWGKFRQQAKGGKSKLRSVNAQNAAMAAGAKVATQEPAHVPREEALNRKSHRGQTEAGDTGRSRGDRRDGRRGQSRSRDRRSRSRERGDRYHSHSRRDNGRDEDRFFEKRRRHR
jgi:peptidyl-prolyl cis-trans isomerase-like 4